MIEDVLDSQNGSTTTHSHSLALTVRRGRATFRDFVRLFLAVRRQPELSQGFGVVYWTLRTLALPGLYVMAALKGKPYYVLIEDGSGRLVGGISMWRGWIGNAVVQVAPEYKLVVLRTLFEETQTYIDSPVNRGRRWNARTLSSNRSIVVGLRRMGFFPVNLPEYLVTFPLGPLTFSIRSPDPAPFSRAINTPLTRLIRGPRV